MLCDANGTPLRFLLSGGQASDISYAQPMLDEVSIPSSQRGRPRKRCKWLLADKGYDAEALRRYCNEYRMLPVIPMRSIADSTPSGHSAHQHPDTRSTLIRTGSRSAATQVCIVSLKPLPPSISLRACASIRPSVRSDKRCAPAGRGSHRPRSDHRLAHAICPPASGW